MLFWCLDLHRTESPVQMTKNLENKQGRFIPDRLVKSEMYSVNFHKQRA